MMPFIDHIKIQTNKISPLYCSTSIFSKHVNIPFKSRWQMRCLTLFAGASNQGLACSLQSIIPQHVHDSSSCQITNTGVHS